MTLLIGCSIVGCRPKFVDGIFPINDARGYAYVDIGSDEKYIMYDGTDRPKETVIDSRVDKYVVRGEYLIVARKSRIKVESASGTVVGSVLGDCEVWTINLITHQRVKLAPPASEKLKLPVCLLPD